jgi:hypothetical protein
MVNEWSSFLKLWFLRKYYGNLYGLKFDLTAYGGDLRKWVRIQLDFLCLMSFFNSFPSSQWSLDQIESPPPINKRWDYRFNLIR